MLTLASCVISGVLAFSGALSFGWSVVAVGIFLGTISVLVKRVIPEL